MCKGFKKAARKAGFNAAAAAFVFLTAAVFFAGCSKKEGGFDSSKSITVAAREEGSGTRSAFVELFGVEEKMRDGRKKDLTTKEAVIAKQTDIMMSIVSHDLYAIGYISAGSLNSTVKYISIEGAAPQAEAVKNGSYPVSRPFYIAALKDNPAEKNTARDFTAFMLSREGQNIASKNYVPVNESAAPYESSFLEGSDEPVKITVGGSSSVAPLMEKLVEEYIKINPKAVIEMQISDSSTGLNSVLSGALDIGLSSRDLKESELEKLSPVKIAVDGIAVIVNKDNPLANASKAQVRAVFTGESPVWSDVIK
ncbi:MAG: substrate-binding domain-containing protein [Spirochaetaceae bacterium]|jgi:phosphate transport system substrate-binding protein|nr:substrate-binding domain-containing protein [Spirochaetaceae bacterium]